MVFRTYVHNVFIVHTYFQQKKHQSNIRTIGNYSSLIRIVANISQTLHKKIHFPFFNSKNISESKIYQAIFKIRLK